MSVVRCFLDLIDGDYLDRCRSQHGKMPTKFRPRNSCIYHDFLAVLQLQSRSMA